MLFLFFMDVHALFSKTIQNYILYTLQAHGWERGGCWTACGPDLNLTKVLNLREKKKKCNNKSLLLHTLWCAHSKKRDKITTDYRYSEYLSENCPKHPSTMHRQMRRRYLCVCLKLSVNTQSAVSSQSHYEIHHFQQHNKGANVC